MFAQLFCKDRNENQRNELYEVISALCHREGVQIEDRGDRVEILAAPQGKIVVTENENDMVLTANTRHAGPGFHAFVIDFFNDIQEELPGGEYEMVDDLEYNKDEDFHRLYHVYENELDYLKNLILTDSDFAKRNYIYDETYYLPKLEDGRIMTAIGDMDKEEFLKTEIDDLMDAFYVWNDWDRDARFYRNAALTLMAKEGVGLFSRMNDQTEKIANEIADYIEIAYEKYPDLALPVKEYRELCEILGRDDKLQDAIAMDKPAIQYRLGKVYHMFENVRVAAPGAAERSYDPVTRSVNLMAPYTKEEEWSWLIQASKSSEILPDAKSIMDNMQPIEKDGTIYWIDDFTEDGVVTVDAVIREDEEYLYIHCVANSEKEVPFLRECILESGFTKA